MAAASKARLRKGLGGATTVWPALCSSRITPANPDASANAPCTRTIVGVADVVMLVASERMNGVAVRHPTWHGRSWRSVIHLGEVPAGPGSHIRMSERRTPAADTRQGAERE